VHVFILFFQFIYRLSNYQLRIARQPPSRTVYQRILKPFPSVMLIGASSEVANNNLFVEATLLRCDSDAELPSCIEGNRTVRISNGVFAVFKKLKILSTTQQQGTLFRLKFTLKRYVGNVFEQVANAVTVSNPIEVFSHTLYLSDRVEGKLVIFLEDMILLFYCKLHTMGYHPSTACDSLLIPLLYSFCTTPNSP
jgi:hypothetical protein